MFISLFCVGKSLLKFTGENWERDSDGPFYYYIRLALMGLKNFSLLSSLDTLVRVINSQSRWLFLTYYKFFKAFVPIHIDLWLSFYLILFLINDLFLQEAISNLKSLHLTLKMLGCHFSEKSTYNHLIEIQHYLTVNYLHKIFFIIHYKSIV